MKSDNDLPSLLEGYKNLVVDYQNSIEKYEKKVASYEDSVSASNSVKCSRVVCYCSSSSISVWKISTFAGDVLYKSGINYKEDTFIYDLNDLNIPIGTKLNVSCEYGGISTNEEILSPSLVYTPDSNASIYFDHAQDSGFEYYGVVPPVYTPNAEPYLKSGGVSVRNSSSTVSRYALYTIDGVKLYESDGYPKDTRWSIKFRDLEIEPYTKIKIKALVVAGEDAIADVILQYDPDSIYGGDFELSGLTSKDTLMYHNTYYVDYDPSKVFQAEKAVICSSSRLVAKFSVILLDGTSVYITSDATLEFETTFLNFNDINIAPGTILRIKVIIPSNDFMSDIWIEYTPNSNTIYFRLLGGPMTPGNRELYNTGILPNTTTPPLLKCSSVYAKNSGAVIVKWGLVSDGKTLFLSGNCRNTKSSLIKLSELNIPPGTRFLIKANVVGGSDSKAYVTMEYDPTSNVVGKFLLNGNAFKNVLIFVNNGYYS